MSGPRGLSPALAAAGHSLFGSAGPAWDSHRPDGPLYDAPAVRLLAASAARRGNLTKAARLLLELIVANPADREMKLVLVSLMILRDEPSEALALLEEFLAADPGDAQMDERKAFVLGHLGRLDEAVQVYTRLIAAFPGDPALLVARGHLLLALGSEQTAVTDYRRAIDCDTRFGEAWYALANSKTIRLSDADIGQMERLLSCAELSPRSRIGLEFALGKAFEDKRIPDLSFAHYQSGNELQAQGAFKARGATEKHVDEAIACFESRYFTERSGLPAEAPIFVIGMPRSGTTLIEQILASHPDVEGTFELPTVSAIARSIGESLGRTEFDYSDMLRGYSDAALQALGQRYLTQSAVYRHTSRPFFIDKMPSNWMHVGLIRAMLPQARIIDVRRDALDCCFSNYAQHYPRGHEFTHSLEDLGRHYRNYERLMAHFDAVAPGAITRVQYEELVERPAETIRRLLEGLRLPFADSCLRFFENDRPVRTPSAQQVRQPINRRGIGRWRQYEPWLGPLIETLGRDAASRPV